jgi:hypothetical protein
MPVAAYVAVLLLPAGRRFSFPVAAMLGESTGAASVIDAAFLIFLD